MPTTIKTNSMRAWVLASRPKTLTGALIPVIAASAMAIKSHPYNWHVLAACVVFATLMQIAANLINDLYDYLKGTDGADRLGPKRACAQGWITIKAMKIGILITLTLALAAGCTILSLSTLWLLPIGAACVLFAFLYTTILSYAGMGDVLVLVFFGLVPCLGTVYASTGLFSLPALYTGLVCGTLIDTLLILNNYRDRDTDLKAQKHTLIAILGERFGNRFYLWCGIMAWLLTTLLIPYYGIWPILITFPYVPIHFATWHQMTTINHGQALNKILGLTSRNMMLFGLLLTLSILIS